MGIAGGPDRSLSADQFAELYDDLLRLANVVAPPGVDGADLLHDAVAACLGRFRRRGGVEDAKTYLARAVINQGRSRRRAWARRAARPPVVERPDEASDRDATLDLLDRLPPRQRACLYLRFVEDLSVDETARLLGCSLGTVKSQTAKALGSLRRDLASDAALEVTEP